jgi:hypothetical protein
MQFGFVVSQFCSFVVLWLRNYRTAKLPDKARNLMQFSGTLYERLGLHC